MGYISKDKRQEYAQRYYRKHKEKLDEQQRQKRRELSLWLHDYKRQLKCNRCSESHPACLEFHHIEDKEADVSYMVIKKYSK